MTKPKMAEMHTPGPWRDGPGKGGIAITAPGWEIPLVATVMDNGRPFEMVAADARLIAASPDLYAALVEAKREMWLAARSSWTMADFKNWAVIQQIDAALEKADGVQRTTHTETEAA